MQDLKILTDAALHKTLQKRVGDEREALSDILHLMREVERRRSYEGCSSLFTFAVKILRYSEDQAARRISAMRLLKSLPELEEKIATGEVNLTHIGVADALFKNEKKQGREFTPEQKTEVFEAMAGHSTRDAQKIALTFAPEAPPQPEKITPVAPGRNRATIELTDEAVAKLEQLLGLLAHKHPHMTKGELIEKLADLGLEQWNPAKAPKCAKKESRAEVSRQVWKRDQNKCTECGSFHAVEEDHRVPKSMGGEDSIENLRLLCRNCNQRAAIEKLGQEKMDAYLLPQPPQVREPARAYLH